MTDKDPYAGKPRTENDAVLAATGRAETGAPCARVAIEKAKTKTPAQLATEIVSAKRVGAAVMYAPADGAVAFHELDFESDEQMKDLSIDGVRPLAPEKVLGFAIYSIEQKSADGHVSWAHEPFAIGLDGEIDHYYAVVWPDGCVKYRDGTIQTQDDRIRLLRAKQEFERGIK
jgi:hypothetical protein